MVALFAIMPLMLAIAVAIRLESRGPVLFRQPRFGLNRSVVLVTKFMAGAWIATAAIRNN